MSELGSIFAAPPSVDITASSGANDRAQAGRSNGALLLAGALQDLAPEVKAAGAAVVSEDQMVQSAAAKKRALELGGKSLADATASGEIAPTQNPFFIQDYNREAAAVHSQASLDALNVDSASWAEKNDPVAFRTKYQKAVADIGQQYNGGPDSQEGFQATATQSMQQAFASNTAYNAARIVDERKENLSALAAKTIIQTNASLGGKASGAQIDAAIEPLRQQWLSTGGRPEDWNKVALQGILAASFNTHSKSILDASKGMSNHLGDNTGTIYDTLGSAEQIETARYRLDGEQRDQLRLQIQMRQQQVFEQGMQAQGQLFGMFGTRLLTGDVTPDEQKTAAAALGAKGLPLAAIATAFSESAKINNSVRELNTDRTALYEQSSGGATHIAALLQDGSQRGWTPELQRDAGQLLLNGQVSDTTYRLIVDTAGKTSTRIGQASGAMGPYKAADVAKATDQWSATRTAVTQTVSQRVKQAYASGHVMTPGQIQAANDVAITAASTHLQLKPGDFMGATNEADKAVVNWAKSTIK